MVSTLSFHAAFVTASQTTWSQQSSASRPSSPPILFESASRFGRQDYWDSVYEKEASYSWYSGWEDLQPFLSELMDQDGTILIPGVGNDAMLVDLYNDGYQQLTAFDYAPEGINRCREMLGTDKIRSKENQNQGVELFVGDARNLPNLKDESFDIVLEKGTLDAIIQSGEGIGEEHKTLGLKNMEQSIQELTRVIRPGGKFISISAICTKALEESPTWKDKDRWEMILDGSLYITEDGYASNNFDGTLLVWTKKE